MSGIEMKAHKGRLVHVRETGRVDQGDQATPVRSLPSRAKDSDYPGEAWFTPEDNSSELYVRKALLPAAGIGEEMAVTFEVWEADMCIASTPDEAEARHYLAIYSHDGPVRLVKAVTTRQALTPDPARDEGEG